MPNPQQLSNSSSSCRPWQMPGRRVRCRATKWAYACPAAATGNAVPRRRAVATQRMGWLPRLTRFPAFPAARSRRGSWPGGRNLGFDTAGVGTNFRSLVVDRCGKWPQPRSTCRPWWSGPASGYPLRTRDQQYKKVLFGDATLQDLPDTPRFVFCATNVQTASLVRFTKKRLADWQSATLTPEHRTGSRCHRLRPFHRPVAVRVKLPEGAMKPFPDVELCRKPFTTDLILSDGGVYDNMASSRLKNCGTCSSATRAEDLTEEEPAEDWGAM